MPYTVNFFQHVDQSISEIEEFIVSQDLKTQTKIIKTIGLLQEFGPFVQMPFSKKLQHQLWELRVKSQNTLIRILYTKRHDVFTLLTIFKKKTQKTPIQEIQKALHRLHEL